jgi:hypothetical protein
VKGRYVLAGENVTFRQFYNLLAEYAKRTSPKWKLPKPALLAAASVATPVFRLCGKDFAVSPGYVRAIVGRFSWYSSKKAQQELQYRIVPAAEIIEASVMDARRRNLGLIELGKSRAAPSSRLQSAPPLLITGVPGWLGNRMVDILVNGDRTGRFASNRTVRLLVEPRFRGLLQLPANFEIHYGDICDAEAVRRAVQGVSSVFHLAGAIYPPRVETLYRVNHEGTRTLVDACVAMGVRRVIYMGTDSICGRGTRSKRVFDEHTPASPYRHYGRSKFMGENYLMQRTKEGSIDGTSLRGFRPLRAGTAEGICKDVPLASPTGVRQWAQSSFHLTCGRHYRGILPSRGLYRIHRKMVLDLQQNAVFRGSNILGYRRCHERAISSVAYTAAAVRVHQPRGSDHGPLRAFAPDDSRCGKIPLRHRRRCHCRPARFRLRSPTPIG